MRNILLVSSLLVAGTAFAAANSYKVTINEDSVVEGKTIKAGDYKLSMENGNAVLKHGKETIELAARQETGTYKVPDTELVYKDGKVLDEIRIGGTTTSIKFDSAAATQSGM